MTRTENLIHPGEILLEDFLLPMHISQNRLATAIHVPTARINALAKGRRAISADTALRFGKFFGTGPEFWTNLQTNYDLSVTAKRIQKEIAVITQLSLGLTASPPRSLKKSVS